MRAIARLRRAIDEYVVEGVPTTLALLRALCDHPAVLEGSYGTATLEAFAATWQPPARDGVAVAPRRPSPPCARPASATNCAAAGHVATRRCERGGSDVLSPMHGLVVELRAAAGDRVDEGQSLRSSRR